jgi:hypothetical protein
MISYRSSKAKWADFLLSAAIACATLWDFRYRDVRVLDMAGLIMLAGFFLLQREQLTGWLQRRQTLIFLFGTIIAYSLLGFILHAHRSSLAIIFLSLIGLALYGRSDWLKSSALFRWLLICHVTIFLVQFGAYYFFGHALDIYALFGAPSRIYRSATEIRAAGLFQEPNSYCLNIFMLTTLVILQRESRILVFLAATTMALSQSQWGLGAAGILVILNEAHETTSLGRFVLTSVATILIIASIFNIYLWTTKPKSDQLPFFYVRIRTVISDPSFRDRYLGRQAGEACDATKSSKTIIEATNPRTPPYLSWIFGEGLTTAFFLQCLPANGAAFLFESLGLVGLIAVAIGLAISLRQAVVRDRIFVVIAIVFSLTTYPLITYLIFWIWLASLIGIAIKSAPDLTARRGPATQQGAYKDLSTTT